MPDSIDDIQLRSEEVQEILTRVPHWMIRWGNLLILGLLILLLFLSWLFKYPDVIPAEAIVTTKIPPQKELAMVTGKIDTILVKDGQIVPEDTPLAILRNTANYQDVFRLKSIIDTVSLNSKMFTFPIEDLPILFLGEIETSYALFESSYSEYMLNKELRPFSNEALANQISLSELYRRQQSLKSQNKIAKTELEITKKDFERQKELFKKGVISTQEYEKQELQFLQVERNFKNNDVQLSQNIESISSAKKASRGTEINQRREEINLYMKVLQSFDQLKTSIKDWELKYVLKSDMKGKVSFLNYRSENQTVSAGDIVFIVVPIEESSYIARIKAPSQNSGKIKMGQTANIMLENFPSDEFGMLQGTVEYISLLPDEEGMYIIEVALPNELITTYGKKIDFKQEMRGLVKIITEDLRLVERFFYQFRDLMDG